MREKKREFYLTPDLPGYGHEVADTVELSECNMLICLPGKSIYKSSDDFLSILQIILVVYRYLYSRLYTLRPPSKLLLRFFPSFNFLRCINNSVFSAHSANIFIPCTMPKTSFEIRGLLFFMLNSLTLNTFTLE